MDDGAKAEASLPPEGRVVPTEWMRAAQGIALGVWLGIVLRLFARR